MQGQLEPSAVDATSEHRRIEFYIADDSEE